MRVYEEMKITTVIVTVSSGELGHARTGRRIGEISLIASRTSN